MESDKIKLRRCQDNLDVCGFGIILMGAWGVLKIIMELFLVQEESPDALNFDFMGTLTDEEQTVAVGIFAAIVAVVVIGTVLIFLLHLYIGKNAQKAAKGLTDKKGYFILSIIFLVLQVLSMPSYILEFQDLDKLDTTIVSLIIDITYIYILWNIVYSSYTMRKIKSAQE